MISVTITVAAALSIPVYLKGGTEFPQRDLILFITFVVILSTLLLQGLTLPHLIRKIKLPKFKDYIPEDEADNLIKKDLAKQSLQHINNNYTQQFKDNRILQQLSGQWRIADDSYSEVSFSEETKSIYLDVLNMQRKWLLSKHDIPFDEDVIRKHLHQIDIEEERLRHL
jgi:CPA1 family monovalent cation:H+ antiporter